MRAAETHTVHSHVDQLAGAHQVEELVDVLENVNEHLRKCEKLKNARQGPFTSVSVRVFFREFWFGCEQ